ncbi:MAG TPA: cellulase family glycosylhydrolase [Alphaproteobacteria bacterium]|jgi:hypothetical protein
MTSFASRWGRGVGRDGLGRRELLLGVGAALAVLPARRLRAQVVPVEKLNHRRFKTLQHGLNISQWFEWVPNDRAGMMQRIDGKYQAQDFAQIRALGFDHVRVTIQPGFLAPNLSKGDPALSAERVKLFDGAMARITQQGLALVLDNHPGSETKDKMAASDSYRAAVGEWWKAFAGHVASQPQYDPERTFLELLNEPEQSFADNGKYRAAMDGLIASARASAPNHTLIVGGNMWNVPEAILYNLKTPFSDANLIYTFHYYSPKSFTHQGVANAGAFYGKLKGVPWGQPPGPMTAAQLAAFDPSVRDSMQRYAQKGETKADMQPIFTAMRQWCEAHGQVAWVGEFGVHFPVAPAADREAWTQAVRELCQENGFGWCMYEARGGFGLFKPGDARPLTVDKPLLAALAL